MSGHSKWSKIKREKGIKDKQRSNVFSKLARIITFAVIEGGGITDPENNIKLRLAIEKAKSLNFPKENIERAIEKGTGPNKQDLKEVIYEAFGPSGVSLIISATTDNANRTLGEVRHVLEINEGKLGNQGSVAYLFKKCGLVIFKQKDIKEKEVFEFSDRSEAFDIDKSDDEYFIYFPYENMRKAREAMTNSETAQIEVEYKPITAIEIPGDTGVKKIIELIEALENLDDVHKVYTNGNI